MLTVTDLVIYDLDGNPHSLSADLDYAEVLDDGLTNDDYTDAEKVLIVLQNGDSFVCNPWDEKNKTMQDLIWDMFVCM